MKGPAAETALDIPPEQHVKTQVAFKKRTDTERCAGMQVLRMKVTCIFYRNTQ
jgi:hypothetical protein